MIRSLVLCALLALLVAGCGSSGGSGSTEISGVEVGTTETLDLTKADPSFSLDLVVPAGATAEAGGTDAVDVHVTKDYDLTVTRIAGSTSSAILAASQKLLTSGLFRNVKVLSRTAGGFVYRWQLPTAKEPMVSFYRVLPGAGGELYRVGDGPSTAALTGGRAGAQFSEQLARAVDRIVGRSTS